MTQYLDEHPGGGEVMLSVAGKDATNDFEARAHATPTPTRFPRPVPRSLLLSCGPLLTRAALVRSQDVGHSSHARSMLAKYELGAFAGGESARPARKAVSADASSSAGAGLAKLLQFLLPLLVVLLAVAAFSLKADPASAAK